MSAAIQTLGPRLQRAIIVRQVERDQWRVEGYESFAGRWRFTWVLKPTDNEARARRHAALLARDTGLPVGEKPLGARITLVPGILGKAAWRAA